MTGTPEHTDLEIAREARAGGGGLQGSRPWAEQVAAGPHASPAARALGGSEGSQDVLEKRKPLLRKRFTGVYAYGCAFPASGERLLRGLESSPPGLSAWVSQAEPVDAAWTGPFWKEWSLCIYRDKDELGTAPSPSCVASFVLLLAGLGLGARVDLRPGLRCPWATPAHLWPFPSSRFHVLTKCQSHQKALSCVFLNE